MLHVAPTAVIAAPPSIFDPVMYVAHMRACGIRLQARRDANGRDWLTWDIERSDEDEKLRDSGDSRVNIDGDLRGERRVWEVLRAEEYIAGARECGVLIFPQRLLGSVRACEFEPDDTSTAFHEFVSHPAIHARQDLSAGVLGAVLCAEIGMSPDDPDLNAKVYAMQMAEALS